MKIGPALRRMMPPTLERKAAGLYRGVFVDLSKVARCLAEQLPVNAHLLDIGGGDGELVNELLVLRPDLHISMVDVAGSVGRFVEPRHRDVVALYPEEALEIHLELKAGAYKAVLVSDVMHHLSLPYRPVFLGHLHRALCADGEIFIKDIEPGYHIATLSLLCDKYISGDRSVALLSQAELQAMAAEVLPAHSSIELGLFKIDQPNYLLRISFADATPAAVKRA